MGSTDSIPQNNFLRLNLDNWDYVGNQNRSQQQNRGYQCLRLKNKMTGEELEQYHLYIRDNDLRNQYEDMLFFRNQNENLVPISYINQQSVRKLCSVQYHLKIYIEAIPLRMCNIKDVRFPQNLYLLFRTFKGFKILYDKVGSLKITQDLICISQEGVVKVWLNPNLSQIIPQQITNSNYMKTPRNRLEKDQQNSMVWELITMVDQITLRESVPQGFTFIQFLKFNRNSYLNFCKAIEEIEKYAEIMKVYIPQVFQSAIKKIRQQKGIFDSQIDANENNQRIKNTNFQSVILNKRFKQSQVERVEGFRNYSNKSFISESNNTFADRLKRHDKNATATRMNAFGVNSGIKHTPTKDSFIYSLQKRKKEINTERPIANLLSMSELSSQPAGAQSLTQIINIRSHPAVIQINSNSNSQILSNSKNSKTKSIFQRGRQMESPHKDTQKPLTYFSQYLNHTEQQNSNVRQRLQTDAANGHKYGMLRNAALTQSRGHSSSQPIPNTIMAKPVVTFFYNTYNNSLNPSLHQSVISNDRFEANNFLSNMPISPPSDIKQFIQMSEQKPAKQNTPNCKQKEQKQQKQQQPSYDENLDKLENDSNGLKQVASQFTKQQNEQQQKKKKQSRKLMSQIQQISQVVQKLQQSKSFLNEEAKLQNSYKIQDKGLLKRRRVVSEQLQMSENAGQPILSQDLTPRNKDKTKKKEVQIISNRQYSQNMTNQFKLPEQIQEFLNDNPFCIDPQIVADLIKYEKKQKRKHKYMKISNLGGK